MTGLCLLLKGGETVALPDSFLQELRYKCDIESIVSQYVNLKKRGNTYLGLCPFHNEKTPSFTVYEDTQSFYCFGCGVGGDVVSFVKKIENLDYIDAVKQLSERAGMTMPADGYDDSLSKTRRRIYEANRAAAKFFHEYLFKPDGKVCLDYYINRGLTINIIKHFGLGYAPNDWGKLIQHLKALGFTESEIVLANLARKGERNIYDNFRNRAMTPIIDIRGNVIAFGGRVLDDSKPKYINTSDTLAYKKTNELFGLNFAKDSGKKSLILCEGYMDVIAMHQFGFTNAIAGCGTALTNEQVKIISRYCREVVLIYDADEAGQKALNKAIYLFSKTDLDIKVPKLTGGKDPDEIIRKFGSEKFKGMLDGAVNDTEFEILKIREKYNISTSDGKIRFLKEVLLVLAVLSPIEQDIYLSKLADELSVNKESIKFQLEDIMKHKKKREDNSFFANVINNSMKVDSSRENGFKQNLRLFKAQQRLIALLFFSPDLVKKALDFDAEKIDSSFHKKAFKILTNRLIENRPIDLTSLTNEFTGDEIAKLAGIQAGVNKVTNSTEEFEDCIKTIEEEYNKSNRSNPTKMSDDEFRKLFN